MVISLEVLVVGAGRGVGVQMVLETALEEELAVLRAC